MPKDTHAEFKKNLSGLVEQFANHADYYTSQAYSETEVRSEFIDMFFEYLGWDVDNEKRRSPRMRDVFREAGETHGRVDYVFRINGSDVFYVEAKAPHVSLDNVDVIMQAKSYAWHSPNVFIVAIADFEEFRLYDATVKPDRKHPNAGLIFEYRYTDYLKPKALDDLWLLSRESVEAGSIDQLLKKSSVQARQRIPVDQAFLEDLSVWREQLAKAVFKTNPALSPADLNEIVQIFLDRLIFIRICEDRRIMDPRQLAEVAENWEHSAKRVSITNDLNALFRAVNDRLNGEIFKPRPVEKIDWDANAALVADIIKSLYFPESPYLFDKIPVELLGSIYERYLGKTIRVTETRAIVEDKPEVRKAGGVYYTPKYIVDYIVEQTVGKLIEGKTPKQIEKLKILDPACGSGSFLIGAYQKLLDYHVSYKAERAEKRGGGGRAGQMHLLQEPRAEYGEIKLSLDEKAAILRNNIFGVDIDPQAVEITMMSLYIKMLDGESGIIAGRAILPRLRDNIKCGNSLIGYDIGILTDDERARINPFDWNSQSEGFGEIMDAGGFDVIIGNPPYAYRNVTEDLIRNYYNEKYECTQGNFDVYKFFVERALKLVCSKGYVGQIVSATFLVQPSFEKLRALLLQSEIVRISPLGPKAFSGATVDTTIIVLKKDIASPQHKIILQSPQQPTDLLTAEEYTIKQSRFAKNESKVFDYRLSEQGAGFLLRVLRSFPPIETGYEFGVGINTGFIRDELVADSKKDNRFHPMVAGDGISRFGSVETNKWIMYDKEYVKQRGKLGRSLPAEYFLNSTKILVVRTRNLSLKRRVIATIDESKAYNLNRLSNIIARPGYNLYGLLGIINSNFFNWLFSTRFYDYEIKPVYLRSAPLANSNDDHLIRLVQRMIALHKQAQETKSDTTRERIEREINVTDEQIDALVYQLYGLTKEEVETVEQA